MPTGAVFLSYASEDAEAALRICASLRAAGIEVWFDREELRGGDAWDRRFQDQIHDCRLFIPVISANTERRDEGYFRREWSLAVDRTRDMAEKKAFLVPVTVDDTRERGASVPEKFRHVQWTPLPGGVTPQTFVDRVTALLGAGGAPSIPSQPGFSAPNKLPSPRGLRPLWRPAVAIALVVVAGGSWVAWRYAVSPKAASPAAAHVPPLQEAAFAPPPHSIAVLPFVNMSGDKEQEYFSDGLSEELLNSLARINELQVAARTSSFYFKGERADLTTITHRLNVASVLEGSVRRSGHTIRITAQLNNAVTGYHLWSRTYDRDLKDVLKLQTEIATAVVNALKITLLGDLAAKIEVGGTRNPAAVDAYIRALKIHWGAATAKEEQGAVDGFAQALRLDPDYALAYAGRSLALSSMDFYFAAPAPIVGANLDRALADALKAIAIAPSITDGHLALASANEASLQFSRAGEEYERALTLAPGNARVL